MTWRIDRKRGRLQLSSASSWCVPALIRQGLRSVSSRRSLVRLVAIRLTLQKRANPAFLVLRPTAVAPGALSLGFVGFGGWTLWCSRVNLLLLRAAILILFALAHVSCQQGYPLNEQQSRALTHPNLYLTRGHPKCCGELFPDVHVWLWVRQEMTIEH